MPAQKLKELLDSRKIPYTVQTHPRTYTAQGVAASLHVSGREFAKSVIVKASGGKLAMAVLPGPRHVDLTALAELLHVDDVELAREEDFAKLFPGCELGAEPPFGNLYSLPVFVDSSLRKDTEIVFNAGTHTETIRMAYADFEAIVKPVVASLSLAA